MLRLLKLMWKHKQKEVEGKLGMRIIKGARVGFTTGPFGPGPRALKIQGPQNHDSKKKEVNKERIGLNIFIILNKFRQ